jgi:Kelch motif protein
VLIDGGNQTYPPVADELYDPTAGTFALTGAPLEARSWGSAIRLNGGAVLRFGGFNTTLGGVSPQDAELYNPGTGIFSGLLLGTSNLLPRVNGTTTLLKNGLVLIAGGTDAFDCKGGSLNTAVAYNPKTKTFLNLPNMVADRDETTATLLPNGKVLIAGGTSYQLNCNGGPIATFVYHGSAELFDPTTRTFTATGALAEARAAHTASLLSNGLVLFAGGYNTPATCTIPCSSQLNAVGYSEIYNLVTGKFSQTGSLNEGRSGPIAAPLANRQVLVAGGLGYAGALLTSAELFSY